MELFRPNVVARLQVTAVTARVSVCEGLAVFGYSTGAAEVSDRAPIADGSPPGCKPSSAAVYDEKTRSQQFAERGLDRVLSVMRCQPGVKRAQSCWIVVEKPPQDIDR
jgi:hypothetical protein